MGDETGFGVQHGDVWQMGRHRLMCGDATQDEDVARLMQGSTADMLFTSPPYLNQRDYTGKTGCWRTLMRAAFAAAPSAQATQILVNLGQVHKDGEWHPYWSPWLEDMGAMGWKRASLMIWDKTAGAPMLPHLCRPSASFEFVFLLRRRKIPLNKTTPCKRAGYAYAPRDYRQADGSMRLREGQPARRVSAYRVMDDVVRLNPAKSNRTGHPAVFPTALPRQFIEAFSQSGHSVYDPFAGTATTLHAAEAAGRIGYGMEISPHYCELALRRWAKTSPRPHRAL